MTVTLPTLKDVLRMFTKRNVVLGILLLTSYAFAYQAGQSAATHTNQDLAVRACFLNAGPYIGKNLEDTFHLMRQCVDDYEGMNN